MKFFDYSFNIIIAKFRMASSVSLFPGLFYVLLVSMLPEFLTLSPALLANTFFIIAIWELFETYRKNEVSGNIVNSMHVVSYIGSGRRNNRNL